MGRSWAEANRWGSIVFVFQAEGGIRGRNVTGVQTCALPIFLGGAAIGFIPGLPAITFKPDSILLLVLPPILYYAAFGTAFREFQRNWKNIFSLAIGRSEERRVVKECRS